MHFAQARVVPQGPPPRTADTVARLRALSQALDQAEADPHAPHKPWLAAFAAQCPELGVGEVERLAKLLELGAKGAVVPEGLPEGAAGSAALKAGARYAGHVLTRRLGQGGMAHVWLARPGLSSMSHAAVALKMPRAGQAPADLSRALLRAEREAISRLQHAHVVRLAASDAALRQEALRDEDEPALALQPVHGLSIDQHGQRHALGLGDRVRLVLQLLSALDHAHGRGVVHADVKPANVLVTPGGRVVLLDFGIAAVDGASAFKRAGHPARRALSRRFASPEQQRGEEASTATDIWAIGLLLARLVRGTGLESRKGAVRAQVLKSILGRALCIPAASRYPSAADFAQALSEWLQTEPAQDLEVGCVRTCAQEHSG